MAGYTNEYVDSHNTLSFPESYIQFPTFKDVDSKEIADLIKEIQAKRNKGLFSEATELINNNYDKLRPYFIDANVINMWVEHLRNTQIYAKQNQQNIYIGDKPEVVQYGDIRIGQPSE